MFVKKKKLIYYHLIIKMYYQKKKNNLKICNYNKNNQNLYNLR